MKGQKSEASIDGKRKWWKVCIYSDMSSDECVMQGDATEMWREVMTDGDRATSDAGESDNHVRWCDAYWE